MSACAKAFPRTRRSALSLLAQFAVAQKAYHGQIPMAIGERSQNRVRVESAQALKAERRKRFPPDPNAATPRRVRARRLSVAAAPVESNDVDSAALLLQLTSPLGAPLGAPAEADEDPSSGGAAALLLASDVMAERKALGGPGIGRRVHEQRGLARPDVQDDYDPADPPAHIRYHIAYRPPNIKDGWGNHPPPERHQAWYRSWCDHRPEEDQVLDRGADGYTVQQMKTEFATAQKAYHGQIPQAVGEKSQNRLRVESAQALKAERRRRRAGADSEPPIEDDFETSCVRGLWRLGDGGGRSEDADEELLLCCEPHDMPHDARESQQSQTGCWDSQQTTQPADSGGEEEDAPAAAIIRPVPN